MKGRVLVIEDDQDISLGIRTVLSRQGLEVDSSPDGKQGLRAFHLARPEPFDLVVLDIGLPGTGLGLSIVKVLTEMHGGHVGVDSTLGRGSTFSVWLPGPEDPE